MTPDFSLILPRVLYILSASTPRVNALRIAIHLEGKLATLSLPQLPLNTQTNKAGPRLKE